MFDQEKLLQDAKKVVKEQAFFMKKALENASLRDGLRHSNLMLSQLKTSMLNPKSYLELFMKIFDELKVLQKYFKDEYTRGRKIVDLYESVQHATSLIPRIYLLITVGSVYIQSHQNGYDRVLQDLIQMLKSVQNPLRGLFLRYYFLKTCKDKLPDNGNQYETQTRTVKDAVDIILTNLQQSNRLWIRLQSGKDKAKADKDRKDLRILVGQNIHRLSSLQGVNFQIYKNNVLPRLFQTIVSSKDETSQNFLLDCLIQVFPDEFHINSVQSILQLLSSTLQPGVDIKSILINLMNRLIDFGKNNHQKFSQLSQGSIYSKFREVVYKNAQNSDEEELSQALTLLSTFQKFTIKIHPNDSNYVNQILKKIVQICSKVNLKSAESQKLIANALTYPLETLSLQVLAMNEFPKLLKVLELNKQKEVALQICNCISKSGQAISSQQLTIQLLNFISPLLQSQIQESQNVKQLQNEQHAVCKLLYSLKGTNSSEDWNLSKLLINKFLKSGSERMKFNLIGALYKILSILSYRDQTANITELVQAAQAISKQVQKIDSVRALKMLLSLISALNRTDRQGHYQQLSQDLFKQVLLIYSQQLTENEAKRQALDVIIGSLTNLNTIRKDQYQNIVSQSTKYCTKLLKKHDQVKYLLKSCHLFFNSHYQQPQRINQIFEKVFKICSALVKDNVGNVSLLIQLVRARIDFSSSVEMQQDKLQREVKLIEQNLKGAQKKIQQDWQNLRERLTQ